MPNSGPSQYLPSARSLGVNTIDLEFPVIILSFAKEGGLSGNSVRLTPAGYILPLRISNVARSC